MQGVLFKCSSKPSTEAELVIIDRSNGVFKKASSLTSADFITFRAGVLPVDG